MLYLAIQMAFLLLVSTLVGTFIGWWAKQVSQKTNKEEFEELSLSTPDIIETNDDVYTLKHRLDKCFDENASLRRDVKVKQTQLNRLTIRYDQMNDNSNDNSNDTTSDLLHDKVTALMDDLQLRDDTILALEKEIEAMKNKGQ